jgi:hypothetical protein
MPANAELPTDETEAVLRRQPGELLELSGAKPNILWSRNREHRMHVRGAALLRLPGAQKQRKAPTVPALHRVPGSVVESLPATGYICRPLGERVRVDAAPELRLCRCGPRCEQWRPS